MLGLLQILNLIGGLGVFLVGMRIMSDGIQNRAGHRLKTVLYTMTENRFAGLVTGIGVTSLIQSSSATTVLLVSLVNAGLVSLKQSIGVIMGANIGTTMTAWVVSIIGFKFSISSIALPAVAFGIPLYFSRRMRHRETANILIGFGLLFLGLGFMKDSVPDIGANPEVLSFLSDWSQWGFLSTLIFIVIGALLTIVVQSSSAAMTITITMAFKGWIGFPAAAAIVLGENIGTTVTAFLASMPMNVHARRAARAHMIFNLIGVVWMLFVFTPFTRFIDSIVPGSVESPENIPIHLSMFHTLFNITNSLLLIGFVTPLSRLVEKVVHEHTRTRRKGAYTLKLVPSNIADSVDSNLIIIQRELSRMAGEVYDMLMTVMNGTQDSGQFSKRFDDLADKEQRIDEMQEQLIINLTRCTRMALSRDQSVTVVNQQRIAQELESIADSAYSIGLLTDRLHKKNWHFHEEGDDELLNYTSQVLDFLHYNQDYLSRKIEVYDINLAHTMENGINTMRDQLRKRSRRTIEGDENADIKGELIFMDIVRHLEHIGDSSLNVSQAIAGLPG